MQIYSFPTFNLAKVLFTAEELGLDYQLHVLDPTKGEHKSPEHLQRHPFGKVPAIQLDDEFFIESNSICRLLAEENGNRLYADTPRERARINQWIDLLGYHIGRWMTVYFFEDEIKPKALRGTTNPDAIAEAAGFLEQQLPVLESALQAHEFITGDKLTIADTIALAFCQIPKCTTLSLAAYPAITAWNEAMNERPAIQRALAQLPRGLVTPF